MSLVEILANPDMVQTVTYLAQQAPAPTDGGGGGGGGGQGAEGFYGVLRQIGEFVRNAGLLILAICVVVVGVSVGAKSISNKDGGGGMRDALGSLSTLLIAGLIIGGGATLVGFAMQFGGELG
ncbi:MAG: hypothetical protein DI630_12675 [Gordonia sp. (in: high G+C Gram-positive bacteria)]|nr:MAG: hypothetical protein DI630_12675 [Gordonia sp. (in: high G+C Gram-positive bacteria)]